MQSEKKEEKKWKEIGLVTFLCVSSADNSFFLFFLIWFSRLCMKVDKKRKSFLDPRLFILYHLVILEIIKDWSSNLGVTNYRLLHQNRDKSKSENFISEKFKKYFYFLTCILPDYVSDESFKDLKKIAIMEIWELVS